MKRIWMERALDWHRYSRRSKYSDPQRDAAQHLSWWFLFMWAGVREE